MPSVARGRSAPTLSSLAFVVSAVVFAVPGAATALSMGTASAVYEEGGGASGSSPDLFWISNDGSAGSIAEVVFDLSGSSGAVFDPSDAPFTVTSIDDVGFDMQIGFDLIAADLLRLVFSGFDPGETFSFGVDIDDAGVGYTYGDEFAGSTLAVVFSARPSPLAGVFVADGAVQQRASASVSGPIPNPEPGTGLLLAVGLAGLAAARRQRRPR